MSLTLPPHGSGWGGRRLERRPGHGDRHSHTATYWHPTDSTGLCAPGSGSQEQVQTTNWRAKLKTIHNGIHRIDTYLDATLDLLGARMGSASTSAVTDQSLFYPTDINPPHQMDVVLHCLVFILLLPFLS
jgi:hypothetical protein